MNNNQYYPIIIVGGGPTGLISANILGVNNIKCLIVEKNEMLY